jgi:hypothetical protein
MLNVAPEGTTHKASALPPQAFGERLYIWRAPLTVEESCKSWKAPEVFVGRGFSRDKFVLFFKGF